MNLCFYSHIDQPKPHVQPAQARLFFPVPQAAFNDSAVGFSLSLSVNKFEASIVFLSEID